MKNQKKIRSPRRKSLSKFNEEMAARIALARKSTQRNQTDMAKALDIPYRTYRSYEVPRHDGSYTFMPYQTLERFCLLTGWNPWLLITGKPNFDTDVKNKL